MAKAQTLIYDEKHKDQAGVVAASRSTHDRGFAIRSMPKYPTSNAGSIANCLWPSHPTDVAYIHHTSGTSTGRPKPVPITHHGAVGVLPVFDHVNTTRKATFTTTPLYHGGPADIFRAWSSSSMIWLFPGVQDKPITADNVLRAVDVAQRVRLDSSLTQYSSDRFDDATKVSYFTCVPFVLQFIAENPRGLEMLKGMELVGVGGAAVSTSLGDRLVEHGVKLISRYGSAECGFIFSSRRNYDTDKAWQYMRVYPSKSLKFEMQDNGLSELIIEKWPYMAKVNRKGGAYATSDLFEAHPSIPHAWKYHSRADSQVNLSTGKKFDPAPMETEILALSRASGLLQDIFIFGNGRPYPGALLFRTENGGGYTKDKIREEVFKNIDQLNANLPPHARLSSRMLTVMPMDSPGLKKSSKGTTLRSVVEEDYATAINQAYVARSLVHPDRVSNVEVERSVEFIVTSVLASKLKYGRPSADVVNGGQNDNQVREAYKNDKHMERRKLYTADLFALGVNSVECMEIRGLLNDNFGHFTDTEIPLNIVYECGTAEKIAARIIEFGEGKSMSALDQTVAMDDLVDSYGASFLDKRGEHLTDCPHNREVVILTGVTGTLGVWILNILRDSDHVEEIHCLVRAASGESAKKRVTQALEKKSLPPLESSKAKVFCHPCTLSNRSTLGLGQENHNHLLRSTTIIIHAAWEVNFSLALPSFEKDHISGLHNLLEFANSSPKETPPSLIFCSSTASVSNSPSSPIPELISHDPTHASPIGYSRSKWVAESICEKAHQHSRLRNRISVLRIGQLCGDGINGIWNVTEAWPLMFSSVKVTGCLPNLRNE
ncbi:MAG: hypothetical protein Q9164_000738, partial [Protoblastenia rupestris]